MVPSDNGDSLIDFLNDSLIESGPSSRSAAEIIPDDTRALLTKIRAAYEQVFAAMQTKATPHPLFAMVCAIEQLVPDVSFVGDDRQGYFELPGMVVAYVNWTQVKSSECQFPPTSVPLGRADVWAIPDVPTGLVWVDHDDPVSGAQTHFPEHGFHTVNPRFTYGTPAYLTPFEKTGLPHVFFGPIR